MKPVALILVCLAAVTAHAANHYIVSGGTGAQTGNDWSNALAAVPASPVRGDTYWMASGSYPSLDLTTSIPGTAYIYFRKATAGDHGTDTGWQSSYDNGPAAFSGYQGVQFASGYYDFEGVTGSGKSGYGFSFYSYTTNNSAIIVYHGNVAPALRFHHCEAYAIGGPPFGAAVSSATPVSFSTGSGDGHLLDHCYIHDGGGGLVSLGYISNVTIQNCYFFQLNSGSGSIHPNGIVCPGNNHTIRYNVFENIAGSDVIDTGDPSGVNGLYVYGNIFWNSGASWAQLAKGIVATTGTATADFNVYVYNNTSYGLVGNVTGVWGGNYPPQGGNFVVMNNIWQNCQNLGSFPYCVMANNVLNTPGPTFVNAPAGDFHLVANTANGTTLPSPFDTDPDGITRVPGAWSLGTYQFVASGNPGNVTMAANQTQVSETGGNATVTVNRGNGSSGAVAVTVSTADGTALDGHDYASTNVTLTWADGSVGARSMQIPIINSGDTATTNRYFTAFLTNITGGATLVPPTTNEIVIVMNPPPPPPPPSPPTNAGTIFLAAPSYATCLTCSNVTIGVTRTGSTNIAGTVNFSTVNGSAVAGTDFTQTSGQIIFNINANGTQTFQVPILNTGAFGPPRSFSVVLSNPSSGVALGLSQAIVSITQNGVVILPVNTTIGGNVTLKGTITITR